MGALCYDENGEALRKENNEELKKKKKKERKKKKTRWMWTIHRSVDGLGNHKKRKREKKSSVGAPGAAVAAILDSIIWPNE